MGWRNGIDRDNLRLSNFEWRCESGWRSSRDPTATRGGDGPIPTETSRFSFRRAIRISRSGCATGRTHGRTEGRWCNTSRRPHYRRCTSPGTGGQRTRSDACASCRPAFLQPFQHCLQCHPCGAVRRECQVQSVVVGRAHLAGQRHRHAMSNTTPRVPAAAVPSTRREAPPRKDREPPRRSAWPSMRSNAPTSAG